jgi:hypothetical protein
MQPLLYHHRQRAHGPSHCGGIPLQLSARKSKVSLSVEDCSNSNR